MLILIFVNDTHKNLNKYIICQIFLYLTRYTGLSKALFNVSNLMTFHNWSSVQIKKDI